MLLNYFGLREDPFGSTPDPRFLFPQGLHAQVLTQLRRDFGSGARFQTLISYSGVGKTTVLFAFREYLEGRARVVYLCNTMLPGGDLLNLIARELTLPVSPSTPLGELRIVLERALRTEQEHGRVVVVILDDAHNLETSAIAEIGGLLPRAPKSLQLVLSGQPVLQEKLCHPAVVSWRQLRPLALISLSPEEVISYVQHHLAVAGYAGESLFTSDALEYISDASEGVPRVINRLCSDALMKAFTLGKKVVTRDLLEDPVDYTELARSLEHVINMEPAPSARVSAPTAAPTRVPAPQPVRQDSFASTIHTWLHQHASIWTGTAGELLSGLRNLDFSMFGAMGTKDLLQALQSNLAVLRDLGIETESRQNAHGPRMIALKLLDTNRPVTRTTAPAKLGNTQIEDQKKVG